MLLQRVRELPEDPQWQYEVKWDGYRMQAIKAKNHVRLLSRNGADYTRRFPRVAAAVANLKPATLHRVQHRNSLDARNMRAPAPLL